ncbi:MAG TPA: hypothetical protein GYA07_05230, partial [Verrucomicrobia bacterium]|nr:hypothetical protein [Verrucomicrobiota bacterium]
LVGGTKTSDGFGGTDFWVVRLDASGNQTWDKSYGGLSQDYLRSIAPAPEGGALLAGHSASDISGNKTSPLIGSGIFGLGDFWVVRIDASGNRLWDFSYGGNDDEVLYAAEPTSDGGFILGGYSASTNSGNKTSLNFGQQDYWIVRIDENGNKLWDRSFGGDGSDILYDVKQTADSGFILAGVSTSGTTGNKTSEPFGNEDVWVIRTDSNGNKLWEKSFGGNGRDGAHAVEVLPDGGFIVGGYSASTNSGNKTSANYGMADFWVIRLDSEGNKLWERSFGGDRDDQMLDLVVLPDGGFALAGYSYSRATGNKTSPNFDPANPPSPDYWLIRLNSDGDKLWETVYGGTDYDTSTELDITSDGGLILGGDSRSGMNGNKTSPNYGEQDFWVLKLAPEVPSPPPPPHLTTFRQTPNSIAQQGFRMFLHGVPNVSYVIEYTPNLGSGWVPLKTNVLNTVPLEITDETAAGNPRRFYRARVAD